MKNEAPLDQLSNYQLVTNGGMEFVNKLLSVQFCHEACWPVITSK
jgi:hypothetical protein